VTIRNRIKERAVYNTMNFIRKMMQTFVRPEKKVLGRWTIEQCDRKLNAKIDLSNEDHCGPCGQYAISQHTQSHALLNHIKPTRNPKST